MSDRKGFKAIVVAVAVVIIMLANGSIQGAQTPPGDCIQLLINGALVYESDACSAPEPTATPQATATVAPTDTPEPPGEPIEPYPDAPPCPTHDDRSHHGLWDRERGCHYDHPHGDDPHDLDGVLGTDIYELMAGEGFGTPWQTISADGHLENDAKHTGYVWYVRSNMTCAESPCVTNLRVVVHQHTLHDASVRFHSYTAEGSTSDGGYFLFGGHMDFGDLHAPEGTIVFNVEGNHCGNPDAPGNHKQHAIEGGNRAPSNIWYGRSRINSDVTVNRSCGFVGLGTSSHDPWIWTSQEAPFLGDYVCYPNPRCRANATAYRMHLFRIFLLDAFPFIYESGVANFEGWADRYGVPFADEDACSSPSVDCTPFVVRGLQEGVNYGVNSIYSEQLYRDYDVYFDGQTAGWAQPPGTGD